MQLSNLLATQASADWNQSLARLLEHKGHPDFPVLLSHSLQPVLAHDNVIIKAYRGDGCPRILYEDYPDQLHAEYIERYLDGMYRLDPVSNSIRGGMSSGILRVNQRTSQLHGSDYYKHYYRELHLDDEIDILFDDCDDTVLVMSIGRRQRNLASTAELRALRNLYPLLQHLLGGFAQHRETLVQPADDDSLSRALASFAGGLLTPREQEIARLMLQGNSSKLIARQLNISQATVKVHRRNLYTRLGVRSELQLCDLFLRHSANGLLPLPR